MPKPREAETMILRRTAASRSTRPAVRLACGLLGLSGLLLLLALLTPTRGVAPDLPTPLADHTRAEARTVRWVNARSASAGLSFQRDIRPILSDTCFACHGPDAETRAANLRLDVAEDGDGYVGAYAVIEPGDPGLSELVGRIDHPRSRMVMPPTDSGLALTDGKKDLLRRWIREGAAYEAHWAYLPPQRHAPPAVDDPAWGRNAIDAFVLGRLEREGLAPSPEADRVTLARRLSLDLTGLPPTPDEVDRFVRDGSPDAYERLVDRLLASPHFGERMALPWLDAARYADTNGFSIDDHRDMWLWREWVIDAYNRNMPFDRFLVEQLAGDLVPEATDRQRLATGFLRNSMNTHEGGTIPEEYRVIYIADKVDTVATVFMGLTMRCAQCHDHKYDPLSQEEFFRFYAFFDTAHEPGMGATNGNTAPFIRADGILTDADTYRQDVERRIATLRRYKLHPPELVEPRARWEAGARAAARGELAAALDTPPAERTDAHWQAVNAAFGPTTELWSRHQTTIDREIAVLAADLEAGRASAMVMQEQGPRQTYVLTRGAYDQPDHDRPVSAGVPAVLPPIGDDAAASRLALARWLTRPDHPLTARVAVNRAWQMLFGNGLVTTPNDFGSQGAYPTHPELLDWLALWYIDTGWDTKALVKLIVTSATYRQSSAVSADLLERDPHNALLARASRFRLPAELVRDNALAISGRLQPRVGGPSVYPRQPHGLWREVSHFGYGNAFTAQAFYPSDPADQSRRSLYTFWKRTNPPPSLSAFDAPTREVCVVQRSRTNTPLQALVLLNDPEYVDAARALADLALDHAEETDDRLCFMFERATARTPGPDELAVLRDVLGQALEHYGEDRDAAEALAGRPARDRAAWTVVASVVLNLDEVMTRE